MTNVLILFLFLILIIMLVASYVIASFGLTFLVGAPFVGTPKPVGREMLTFAKFKPGETFVDLGSGSGTLLILAVKEFGAKKAIGYEINPTLALWTKIKARLAGVGGKVEVRTANFFKSNIEPADVVGLFLLDPTMDKLLAHMQDQLPSGTRIVSRGFKFKAIEPARREKGGLSNLYLYLLD